MQTASDESYRDPTNLQSKLQKHQAFEAELSANKGRVDSVRQVQCQIISITSKSLDTTIIVIMIVY